MGICLIQICLINGYNNCKYIKKIIMRPRGSSMRDSNGQTRELKNQVVDRESATQVIEDSEESFYIVGIGASAGGLEALEQLFRKMPDTTGMGFVVIQHLSPDHKSLMVELLSKHTAMDVIRAENGVSIEPDKIYVLPPKKTMTLEHGVIQLIDKDPRAHINLPIDMFLSSLARDRGEHAVGIILSGTGSDGTRGIRSIKEVGGLVMVQEQTSAKFDGMPRSAISTGLVDFVLHPNDISSELIRYTDQHKLRTKYATQGILMSDSEKINAIFQLVKNQNNIDFAQYKPTTIARRIQRRMDVIRLETLDEYLRHLLASPREVTQLCKEMLIGVTSFFRDMKSFQKVGKEVIPEILSGKQGRDSIRVWCAGCSTGEEAYTLGILFAQAMEERGTFFDVKIFATDVDRDVLEFASAGSYPDSIAADVPEEYLRRYFTHLNGKYSVTREIRELIVFAPQNLIKDPPFTKIDLVSCRNLLIYLQPVLQTKVYDFFRFSLLPGGYLFLGGSETLGDHSEYFETVDAKYKLYRMKQDSKSGVAQGLNLTMNRGDLFIPHTQRLRRGGDKEDILVKIIGSFLDQETQACMVLNEKFQITYTFGDPGDFVSFTSGEASLDITKLVPKDLSLSLSTALYRAQKERKTIHYKGILLKRDEQTDVVNIRVSLVEIGPDNRLFYMVFLDIAQQDQDQDSESVRTVHEEISQHVSDLENDLHYTRENLQATVEELETSNEELQAANEELLSSNEELQSTNEELQSVNEELFTVNTEYQQKIKEMTELNNDIENLVRCTDIGSVFLDNQMLIRRYTPAMNEFVNIIDKDVGRNFFDLTHKLDYVYLEEDTRAVRETKVNVEKQIAHIDGRPILLKIVPYLDERKDSAGTIINLIDLTAIRNVELDLMQRTNEKDIVLEVIPDPILFFNGAHQVVWANKGAFASLGLEMHQLLGKKPADIWGKAGKKLLIRTFQSGKRTSHQLQSDDGRSWVLTDVPVFNEDGSVRAVVENAHPLEQQDAS
ncbi:MAG: chemotaxis protein CheR [Desulfobulbaceae bacterium]|nr:MAG: chemotaxis protein CheR [Desulfobulbaceae bacterium]